mmetsp:Transcript_28739/g.51976  ORF Transcript_28739/g.51976 Transcript_28739/m.51976 type:complete len:95 (+) Transcript_28739:132-416(+)
MARRQRNDVKCQSSTHECLRDCLLSYAVLYHICVNATSQAKMLAQPQNRKLPPNTPSTDDERKSTMTTISQRVRNQTASHHLQHSCKWIIRTLQ